MSAGVLLKTAKLTRHNKAGAYQTLTVQFKLVPLDAKLPLDKLLITEAWAKENHLLTQGSGTSRRRRSRKISKGGDKVRFLNMLHHAVAARARVARRLRTPAASRRLRVEELVVVDTPG